MTCEMQITGKKGGQVQTSVVLAHEERSPQNRSVRIKVESSMSRKQRTRPCNTPLHQQVIAEVESIRGIIYIEKQWLSLLYTRQCFADTELHTAHCSAILSSM